MQAVVGSSPFIHTMCCVVKIDADTKNPETVVVSGFLCLKIVNFSDATP